MRKLKKLVVLLMFTVPFGAFAQTSWKGTSSTSWNNAANWTAGVPTSALDAIVGDAIFTWQNQPSLTVTSIICLRQATHNEPQ